MPEIRTDIYEASTVGQDTIYVKSPYHPRFSEYATAMRGTFIHSEKVWKFTDTHTNWLEVTACVYMCYGTSHVDPGPGILVSLDIEKLENKHWVPHQQDMPASIQIRRRPQGGWWVSEDKGRFWKLDKETNGCAFYVPAWEHFLACKHSTIWDDCTTIIPDHMPWLPGKGSPFDGSYKGQLTTKEYLLLHSLYVMEEDRRRLLLLALQEVMLAGTQEFDS